MIQLRHFIVWFAALAIPFGAMPDALCGCDEVVLESVKADCCVASSATTKSCCSAAKKSCCSSKLKTSCCGETECQCGISCQCGDSLPINEAPLPSETSVERTVQIDSTIVSGFCDAQSVVTQSQPSSDSSLVGESSLDRCITLCRFAL